MELPTVQSGAEGGWRRNTHACTFCRQRPTTAEPALVCKVKECPLPDEYSLLSQLSLNATTTGPQLGQRICPKPKEFDMSIALGRAEK